MDLTTVLMNLYGSEINCSISSFWDDGFLVQFGDDMNGFVAEAHVRTPMEAAVFLDKAAREHFPESAYALGPRSTNRRCVGVGRFTLSSDRCH
jgi:hypothetical protein